MNGTAHNKPINVALVSALIGGVQMIVTMDITTLGILLPSIGDDFHVSKYQLSGILGYGALVFACFMLVGGKLTDQYGPRLCITGGLATVLVGAAMASLAPSFSMLLVARAIYGFGLAMIMPANFALLNTAIPEGAPRQKAYSIFAALQGIAQFVGPAGGGYLAGTLGWRAFFGANVIFVMVLIVLCARSMPRSTLIKRPFDWFGACLFVPAVAMGVLSISGGAGAITGWSIRLALGFTSIALLAVFARSQRTHGNPLLPPSVTAQPGAKALFVAMGATMAASSGLFLLPGMVMQRVLGMAPADAGMGMLPHALAATLTGHMVGWFMARLSLPANGLLGMGVLGLGLLANGWMQPEFGYLGNVLVPMVIGAAGSIFSVIMLSALISSMQSEREQGVASALIFVCQQVGIALGSTALLTITELGDSPIEACNLAFRAASVIAFAGFASILFAKSRSAHATAAQSNT